MLPFARTAAVSLAALRRAAPASCATLFCLGQTSLRAVENYSPVDTLPSIS